MEPFRTDQVGKCTFSHFSVRRQYPPLSLLDLQRLIDLGRVDPEEPIDLTTLCNTKIITVNPQMNHYGIHLTDEVNFVVRL